MVAGASEVWLPDCGGNPAAVACGDCLRMAVDVLPSGKLGREFLAGNAGRKELPFLAGADRCRRNGMLLVAVLRDGIRKQGKEESMFKELAYWMYYFWNKNKRVRKNEAAVSNAMWTMALLWFLNLMALHLLFELWGWDMLTGWFSSLMGMVE